MNRESCSSRIKKALDIRGIKQVELCEKTNIPKSAMSQYVNGSFEPKQDRVWSISKALNVSEAWLMGYDVPMERKEPATNEGNGFSEETLIFAEKASRLSPEKLKTLRDYMEYLESKGNQ